MFWNIFYFGIDFGKNTVYIMSEEENIPFLRSILEY